jgi:hypothetical protein
MKVHVHLTGGHARHDTHKQTVAAHFGGHKEKPRPWPGFGVLPWATGVL